MDCFLQYGFSFAKSVEDMLLSLLFLKPFDANSYSFYPRRSELSFDPCAVDVTPTEGTIRNSTYRDSRPTPTESRPSTEKRRAPVATLPTSEAPPTIEITSETSQDET